MRVWMVLLAVKMVMSPALAQQRYDVLITEIMADPTPVVGLPAVEWIEIQNHSTVTWQVQGWRIADATGQSGPMPAFLLKPDSILIICSSGSLAALSAYGTAVSVTSFPSLDNAGDLLSLRTAGGMTMHAVAYETGWMNNPLKEQGGWSLEMIDPRRPCLGENNWRASEHPSGGTPGRTNSVNGNVDDTEPPLIKRSFAPDERRVRLLMNEPVDSAHAVQTAVFEIPGATVSGISVLPPLFLEIELLLSQPLDSNRVYEVRCSGLRDCEGNTLAASTVRTGLPTRPLKNEWIINELLFDPRSGAYDWVEMYNHSDRILDLSKLFIANRTGSGQIGSVTAISPVPFLVFPGEYLVVTEDADLLSLHYLVKEPGRIIELPSLPSWPDDEGRVLLLDPQGEVLDELLYDEDWHFPLLADPEGVSLERIHFGGATQDRMNWHSAASSAGYGTPGYKNSQYHPGPETNARILIEPKIFSPDNDGRDDLAILSYELEEPGFMATVLIFDYSGRPVRFLVRNKLAGMRGAWTWDGLDEKGRKLPVGIYFLLAELFHPDGRKKVSKLSVALARSF